MPERRSNTARNQERAMDDLFDFLTPRPSFLTGMARVFDLGGVLTEFHFASSPEEADFLALRSDWEAVGNDIRAGIAAVEREVRQSDVDERTARSTGKESRAAAS